MAPKGKLLKSKNVGNDSSDDFAQKRVDSSDSSVDDSSDDEAPVKSSARFKFTAVVSDSNDSDSLDSQSSDSYSEDSDSDDSESSGSKGKDSECKTNKKTKNIVESAKPTIEKPGTNGKKKGKASDGIDDIDALLAEIEAAPTPDTKGSNKQEKKINQSEQAKKPIEQSVSSLPAPDVSAKPSKAQLKKMKQKQKKEQHESDDATPTPAVVKKGPVSAAAKAAQLRVQALKEQQELIRMEEEKRQQEEMLQRQKEEEEERIKEEERKKKEQRRLERRQRLKEDGKLLTAKEKQALIKKNEYLKQLQDQGIVINPDADAPTSKSKAKTSKAVDNKKKRVEKQNQVESKKEVSPPPVEVAHAKKEIADNWEDLLDGIIDKGGNDGPSGSGQQEVDRKKEKRQVGDARKRAAMEAAIQEAQSQKANKLQEAQMKTDSPQADKPSAAASGKAASPELRSPICCIMGHVDTGKTKLLDKIRHTNVQLGEAGGITQQIGATFFPKTSLWDQCKKIDPNRDLRLPGLLIIDTPGHASFTNLRARGSSLCDLAIVVIDIMHGMEPQTRESLGLLKQKRCPFVIALNKIDRLYDWNAIEWGADVKALIANQKPCVQDEFRRRADEAMLQLAEEGFNCSLYWENKNVRSYVSIVPTSAHTGEGVADLIHLICSLNETLMEKSITKLPCIFDTADPSLNRVVKSKGRPLQCTILEVKAIDGLGTTIDVILVQGILYEGDRIVCCGMHGPIITTIRALLTPQPLKELRVKGEYIQHAFIQASMGVKISAPNLEEAVAGTSMFVVENDDDLEILEEEVMKDMSSIFKNVDRTGNGVYVMASTLGSLEALLVFLHESKIPVFAVNIGPVQKKDIKKASIMREKGRPELSVVLAFNVKVDPEAEKEAKLLGVRIMTAEIIYHLFDEFTKYFEEMKEEKKKEFQEEAIFPCVLSILPQFVFNKKDPIIVGVVVEEGTLKVGTPLCVADKGDMKLGRVTSLELNRKPCDKAVKGQEVCIKIVGEPTVMVGRQFDVKSKICSRLTRQTIDCLKDHFRDEMTKEDWKTVITIKKMLNIN